MSKRLSLGTLILNCNKQSIVIDKNILVYHFEFPRDQNIFFFIKCMFCICMSICLYIGLEVKLFDRFSQNLFLTGISTWSLQLHTLKNTMARGFSEAAGRTLEKGSEATVCPYELGGRGIGNEGRAVDWYPCNLLGYVRFYYVI